MRAEPLDVRPVRVEAVTAAVAADGRMLVPVPAPDGRTVADALPEREGVRYELTDRFVKPAPYARAVDPAVLVR